MKGILIKKGVFRITTVDQGDCLFLYTFAEAFKGTCLFDLKLPKQIQVQLPSFKGSFPFNLFLLRAVLGDYGWAPQRDSNGNSLSGAQLFLGTITNEKEP